MKVLIIKFFVFVLLLLPNNIIAQNHYFYTNKDYGSEAIFNPISLILNGSYDIIQLQNHNRNIWEFNYRSSAKNVFYNLGSPFHQIKKYGWEKFFSNEIFPLSFKFRGAQWWPNYQLHLIGGGMTFVEINEWYKEHNFPSPIIFSLATIGIYHLLNEVVENKNYKGTNVDPIADIYFFDIGGIVLFSFDNIKNFFRNTLNLSDWSLQPSFILNDGTLQNNGQYFSIKYKLPFFERWHFFYYFGMNGLAGFSYKFNKLESISLGLGLRAKKIIQLDNTIHKETIETTWNIGVFYDKNNSLMSSLMLSGLTDYRLQLNVYPGLLKFGKFNTGFWFVYKTTGNFLFGISTVWSPGLGIIF